MFTLSVVRSVRRMKTFLAGTCLLLTISDASAQDNPCLKQSYAVERISHIACSELAPCSFFGGFQKVLHMTRSQFDRVQIEKFGRPKTDVDRDSVQAYWLMIDGLQGAPAKVDSIAVKHDGHEWTCKTFVTWNRKKVIQALAASLWVQAMGTKTYSYQEMPLETGMPLLTQTLIERDAVPDTTVFEWNVKLGSEYDDLGFVDGKTPQILRPEK